MSMSKDRVRFTIPAYSMTSRGDGYRALLSEVFGHSFAGQFIQHEDITIICRPSQFARFLIKRNEMGMQNGFKELKPELFTPPEEKKQLVFDVSKNPNRVVS
jgi:hypothetical protein